MYCNLTSILGLPWWLQLIRSKCHHYVQIFEGCKFWGFCGQLVICEIIILKILLANLWLVLIGDQNTREWHCLTLARNDGILTLSAAVIKVVPKWTSDCHLVEANSKYIFQAILYGPNSGLWYILAAILIHRNWDNKGSLAKRM